MDFKEEVKKIIDLYPNVETKTLVYGVLEKTPYQELNVAKPSAVAGALLYIYHKDACQKDICIFLNEINFTISEITIRKAFKQLKTVLKNDLPTYIKRNAN